MFVSGAILASGLWVHFSLWNSLESFFFFFISIALKEGIHEACGMQFKERGRIKVQPLTSWIPSPALTNHFSSCLTAQTKYESTWKKKSLLVFFKLSIAKGNGCPRLGNRLSGTPQVPQVQFALKVCFVKPDRLVMFCPLLKNFQELFAICFLARLFLPWGRRQKPWPNPKKKVLFLSYKYFKVSFPQALVFQFIIPANHFAPEVSCCSLLKQLTQFLKNKLKLVWSFDVLPTERARSILFGFFQRTGQSHQSLFLFANFKINFTHTPTYIYTSMLQSPSQRRE